MFLRYHWGLIRRRIYCLTKEVVAKISTMPGFGFQNPDEQCCRISQKASYEPNLSAGVRLRTRCRSQMCSFTTVSSHSSGITDSYTEHVAELWSCHQRYHHGDLGRSSGDQHRWRTVSGRLRDLLLLQHEFSEGKSVPRANFAARLHYLLRSHR